MPHVYGYSGLVIYWNEAKGLLFLFAQLIGWLCHTEAGTLWKSRTFQLESGR